MKTCTVNNCDREHRAKGVCAYHYRIQNPPVKNKAVECPNCGELTMKRDADRKFCSLICRDLWRIETGNNAAPPLVPRTVSYLPTGHPVSILMRAVKPSQISPLRTAYESHDWPAVLGIIEDQCVKVDECWLWSRRHSKGYGKLRIAGRDLMAHRLSAMAYRQGDLDARMPVHHMCAEPLCCNPSHLQVVTPQENTAEMLERRYYVARIAQLEAALIEADPTHPMIRIARAI